MLEGGFYSTYTLLRLTNIWWFNTILTFGSYLGKEELIFIYMTLFCKTVLLQLKTKVENLKRK